MKLYRHIILLAVVLVLALPALSSAHFGQPPHGLAGQFQVHCGFSHRATVDPIVFPGVTNASHLHDFFGNTSTDSRSTFRRLRKGPGLCSHADDLSAYWVPTLYHNGNPVTPLGASIYYRVARKDPSKLGRFPRGFKLIAGDAKATTNQDPRIVHWSCGPLGFVQDPASVRCPTARLILTIRFPDCWDGRNLDSKDHRSHVVYPTARRQQGMVCPDSHPVAVPRIALHIRYPVSEGQIALSSGPAITAHADFFNAWKASTLRDLVRACLNADTDCGFLFEPKKKPRRFKL